jgi:hypothetical protein
MIISEEETLSENIMEVEPEYVQVEVIPRNKEGGNKKGSQKVVVILVAISIILASILFLMSTSQETNTPVKPGFNIEMLEADVMEYQFYGECPGDYAHEWRERIDDHGDQNGIVTKSEVNEYLRSANERAIGARSLGVRINGSFGNCEQYKLQLNGVTGAIDSDKTFIYSVSYRLKFILFDKDTSFLHFFIINYWDLDNDFKFKAPEGYMIHNVSGLNRVDYNADKSLVSAIIERDRFGIEVIISEL